LAPLSWWPLTILAIALLAWSLQQASLTRAFWLGWLFGLGQYGVGVSWVYVSIHYYGHTSIALSLLMTLFFAAGLALLVGTFTWCYRRLSPDQTLLVSFPALWLLFDWVRTWILSGFPWLLPGYSLIDSPTAIIAPLLGVFGMTWIAVFSACLLTKALLQPRRSSGYLGALAALWIGCALLPDFSWTIPDRSQPIRVALVQGNISQERKWDPAERDNILDTYVNATTPLWGKQDLIVWPEAAFPVFYADAIELIETLDRQGKATGTTLISGTPYWEYRGEEVHFFNSIFARGNGSGLYHKQVLVPFGEFVPLEQLIRGLLPFFDLPLSSFTEGSSHQSALFAGEQRLAPFICYEIVFPELVRQLGAQADLLLTISNDAWFGRSWGPDQHYDMARLRAMELGKYLLRGTNTGITAVISPQGEAIGRLPQFSPGVLESIVYPVKGNTPYSHWGYWPVLLLAAISLLVQACLRTFSVAKTPKLH
jgi:apolipoprotein N-acyltransferase